jgi:hypothetical protein
MLTQGVARIERDSALRLVLENTSDTEYSNAQIDDYLQREAPNFNWRPPLRLTVRAWVSHEADQLKGTAGFGFWTQPLMPGRRLPILPATVWFFFASAQTNMAFARDVPGYGWKAATLDATRLPFLLLLPTAPLGFLLMRVPALYRLLWPIAQRAIGVSEALVPVMLTEPHTYRIDWLPGSIHFFVDDRMLHQAPFSPRGPLGFVAWLDNRYAILTPQGQTGRGLIAIKGRQWLSLDDLKIEPM